MVQSVPGAHAKLVNYAVLVVKIDSFTLCAVPSSQVSAERGDSVLENRRIPCPLVGLAVASR